MKNWWYYYKWYVVCGSGLVILILYLAGNALGIFGRTPDYQIAISEKRNCRRIPSQRWNRRLLQPAGILTETEKCMLKYVNMSAIIKTQKQFIMIMLPKSVLSEILQTAKVISFSWITRRHSKKVSMYWPLLTAAVRMNRIFPQRTKPLPGKTVPHWLISISEHTPSLS